MARKKMGTPEYRQYKQGVLKKVSMANKRLTRLENNQLHSSPAYREWQKMKGGERFSVRGKSYRELQKENAKLNHFLQSKTSTVRGSNKILKSIAKNTGIKYKKIGELHEKAPKFFRLAAKVSEYLHTSVGASGAIGYQAVWHSVSNYMAVNKVSNVDSAVDSIVGNLQQGYEDDAESDFDDWTKL